MAGVAARHQCSAGWSANGAAGIEVSEAHALSGQFINICSFDFRLPVAAQVAVAQIVRDDENDARLARSGR